MKGAVHNLGVVIGLLLGAVSCPLHAVEIDVERIHEEPETLQEDPQDYLKITIGKQVFRSASLGDWRILSNYSGMDLAAFPSDGRSVMVGLKIEPCMNAEGKNYSCFTPELLAVLLKRLKPEGAQYEGKDPALSGAENVVDLYFMRIEDKQTWKCRYQLRLVNDQLWIFMCEAGSSCYYEACQKFAVLTGTFVAVAGEK